MEFQALYGVLLHWTGGLAAASFYVPSRGIRHWGWETYWLVQGVFSWIVAPILLCSLLAGNPFHILAQASPSTLFWCFFFGLLWGIGGLTFGLTMRYLGLSLGAAITLGFCAAFGTLVPPIVSGDFLPKLIQSHAGNIILGGILLSFVGIAIAGLAGLSKEKDLSPEARQQSIKEYSLGKGLIIAVICGIMSACFAYGLTAGSEIKKIALASGSSELWQGLPVLIIVLLGGFTTNLLYCVALNLRNKTAHQYFAPTTTETSSSTLGDSSHGAPSSSTSTATLERPATASTTQVPLLRNYALCALGGLLWYLQFFFYSMGETKMGKYSFSSWTMHMASIILFATLWGIAVKEWKGTSPRTRTYLASGLALLIGATVVIGYGNYQSGKEKPATPTTDIQR